MTVGSAWDSGEETRAEIRGRDLVSGLPKVILLSSTEVRKAIEEPVAAIIDAVRDTLDKCPPELAGDIMDRGIALTGSEKPDELADLLSAVERFESAVEAHGGDLMVDDLKSSRPDDRHFVLPRRGEAESARAYMVRIGGATEALRRHPRHPG